MAFSLLSESAAVRVRATGMALLFACVMFSLSCSRAARSSSDNPDCDQSKMQAMVNRGYDLLSRGQWYQAHLAAHALISIGRSCNEGEIAVPATVQGDYILAYVARQVGDANQERNYVSIGLTALSKVKEHESEAPVYASLYDQLEPKFLELQAQLH